MVGIHLCGGQIKNVALFSKSDGCEMERKMPPCHNHQSKPCCEDETIVHTGDDFNISITDITISVLPSMDVELPPVVISEVIPSSFVSFTHFYNYDPPLRATDRIVSFQVFLI